MKRVLCKRKCGDARFAGMCFACNTLHDKHHSCTCRFGQWLQAHIQASGEAVGKPFILEEFNVAYNGGLILL